MRKIIYPLAFITVLLFSSWYLFRSGVFAAGIPTSVDKLVYQSLCYRPIEYRIGSIDERFKITKEELQKDIEKAGNIWSKEYGKNLFVLNPEAELSINMVYDNRQSLNNEIDELKDKLEEDRSKLDPKVSEYEKQAASFKSRVDALNSRIADWNAKGGAPEYEYKKLLEEQKSLKAEGQTLNQMARSLNRTADDFNSQVNNLNQTVDSYNKEIQIKPEEGFYDGPNQRIDIYFLTSKDELIHTLAHEMGHALGMDHNEGKESIMHPQTSESLKPTPGDLVELQKVCAPYNIFQPLINILSGKKPISEE